MTAAALAGVAALGFMALGRWGLRNTASLVTVTASPERRERDERSLRRGARSCVALGVVFACLAVVVAIEPLLDTT
ncbi:MAG: hypothetical protein JWQ91_1901 [Aeromicrobium sp.]|jgi:hypothetical protein|nr:hypothetical protein [Aeromicrobium sp.]MCW2824984.1 hypothetical protein [Aeromicrobium sp.]